MPILAEEDQRSIAGTVKYARAFSSVGAAMVLGLGGMAIPAGVAAPRELKCSAVAWGMAHELKLTVRSREVVAFDYSSVNPRTAHECGLSASKIEPDKEDDFHSVWSSDADGSTVVHLSDKDFGVGDNGDMGTVRISRSARSYKLTVSASSAHSFCGTAAYIAPTVTLTEGRAKCRLSDADPGKSQ